MIRYRTEGFIFKTRNRSEADRVFSVFTKESGRVELSAKAVRKINSKLRGGAELFSVAELEFIQGRLRATLTDAVTVRRFADIARSPEKFAIACAIAKIIDECMGGQERDEDMFYFLTDTFAALQTLPITRFSLFLAYLYFFWNFMALVGYHPELHACACCHKALSPDILHYSAADGGLLCPACAKIKKNIVPLLADAVKIMRIILKKEWDTVLRVRIEKGVAQSLKEVSKGYYEYVLATHHDKHRR